MALTAARFLHVRENGSEMALNGGVTLASRFLEPGAIRDRNLTAAVMNKAFALEGLRRCGNRRALDAKQLGEKFLSQRKIARRHAILRCKQPAAATFFDRVQRITGDRLQRLRKQHIGITAEEVAQVVRF